MPNIDIYTFEPLLLHQITEVTGTSNVKKGHSYLEIEGLDRYLTLPTNLVPKVQACLAKCDGYHTLARILETQTATTAMRSNLPCSNLPPWVLSG
jgi:hypothetical protein